MDLSKSGGVTISKAHLRERKMGRSPSPWQKSALFAVSIVGAVCDRAFFLELTKCGRSQTAPTVGNPSLRLLPRAARCVTPSLNRITVSKLAKNRGRVLLPLGQGGAAKRK